MIVKAITRKRNAAEHAARRAHVVAMSLPRTYGSTVAALKRAAATREAAQTAQRSFERWDKVHRIVTLNGRITS